MTRNEFEFIYGVVRQKFRKMKTSPPSRQEAKLLMAGNVWTTKLLDDHASDIVSRASDIAELVFSSHTIQNMGIDELLKLQD
jgi:hypothetical protein